MKIVIFDDADYDYAQDAAERYADLPLYLQPGNDIEKTSMDLLTARMRWLVDKVKDDQWFSATVLPQLHVMLWGNMRGV
jgi:7-carboxy-7-deazaguanine synthase